MAFVCFQIRMNSRVFSGALSRRPPRDVIAHRRFQGDEGTLGSGEHAVSLKVRNEKVDVRVNLGKVGVKCVFDV